MANPSVTEHDGSSELPKFFCRKRTELQERPSGGRCLFDFVEDSDNTDSKRARLSSDEPTDEAISVHEVLDMISPSDLKAIVKELLVDKVAGPVLKRKLLATTDNPRNTPARKHRNSASVYVPIHQKKDQEIINEAYKMRGLECGSAWAHALQKYLPCIKELAECGPLVDSL
ncbi:hypothetical protein TSTA_073130 [Talaromyces stipitatus ATCC 10500]|uniref:Uncharacterized protein n=1 Tax=Talaromyces stipitatus (strain ATCC 10500 / CBS 375.48 / QM 6759 / NRRL 1006) TaxID=441959 RepID=B8LUR6_TALSN|nr:uncharacterized protein TSTA_073130 [Talaromyces stipitatus ATCC 10500]EED23923.1 hypothetical protein TSTA_073130 [Talaromyces stipitatus ATCC 10500]